MPGGDVGWADNKVHMGANQFQALLFKGSADQFEELDPLLLRPGGKHFEVVLARELANDRFEVSHGRNPPKHAPESAPACHKRA
jgi:hypothetical protein